MIAATRSQTMNPNPDVVVFYMQICPMGQPQEEESPRRCGEEVIRALTEINTTSGDVATVFTSPSVPVIAQIATRYTVELESYAIVSTLKHCCGTFQPLWSRIE